MISKTRHTEVTAKGEYIYIIKPYYRDANRKISNEHNSKFSGVRYRVPFHNGVGRTTSREKARLFSEELEYMILLHKDDEPWVEVKEGQREDIIELIEEESTYEIDESEDY